MKEQVELQNHITKKEKQHLKRRAFIDSKCSQISLLMGAEHRYRGAVSQISIFEDPDTPFQEETKRASRWWLRHYPGRYLCVRSG